MSTKYIKQSIKKTGTCAVGTFQWIASANAPTVTFYGAFNYANNNNANSGDIIKKSSVTYFATTTGIQDNVFSKNLISVFPNPTTEILHLMSTDVLEKGLIYSIDGKLAKTVSEQELLSKTISVTELNSGLYYLHVTANGKNSVARFAKN